MALTKKDEQKVIAKVFGYLSVVAAVVALVLGVIFWQVGNTIVTNVNKNLADQKVYFPPKGSPGFDSAVFAAAQKHAGQQVKDGELAKAFAQDYVGVQAKLVGNGKTLSEVTAQAVMNPTNPALQQQQATMFQLETTKNLLLGNGYGMWAQGMMFRTAGTVAFAAAGVLVVIALVKLMYYKKG